MAKTNLIISFLLLSFFSSSLADYSTPDSICSLTPHPNFCKSFLPFSNNNPLAPSSLHDYGRSSLSHSLSHAQDFHSMVDHFSSDIPSTSYSNPLQDCHLLSELNIDYLSQACEAVKGKDTFLEGYEADDLMTWLSSTITNQETCLEGLSQYSASPSSSFKNAMFPHLYDGELYNSVSLALFKHGWVRDDCQPSGAGNNGRWLAESEQIVSKLARSRSHHLLPRRSHRPSKGRSLVVADGIQVSQIVVVNQYGTGNFSTISDAVAMAPNNTELVDGYYVIHLMAGVYEEYVSIPKQKRYIMLIGDGINQTVITGNRSVVDGWTTFNSATFAVLGRGFVAVNVTFRNTAGPSKHQAVAVRNGADKSTFYSCSFEGYQDTLYAHSQRQFYRNCDIYGTIDYIFGNAAAVLQNCNIYSRRPMDNQFNTVTAQGRTDQNQNTGTSVQNCAVLATEDLKTSNVTTKTYLGRPWKEYSTTIVMESFVDGLIDPAGWTPWNASSFALDTLYYAEFNNTGPGSSTRDRVHWLGYHVANETDAKNFTVSKFLGGNSWLPQTGVPYTAGLN
ncbi:unnamed protein product [Linum tenue]|uniref:Pectinesterase n=1 Tax=Linum tenue TaxID=586396 RepID=A0AAV0R2A1_9ROSI|nr:unnamed protein product [Linum tenue]